MPEGDTIHAAARRLSVLVGTTIVRATTQGLERDLDGRTITAVSAHGKHLLIDLDDATRIRIHLGMTGRIRTQTTPARGSPGDLSLVLETAGLTAVFRRARTIEIAARRAPMRDVKLASLGPDILAPAFDVDAAAERALARTGTVSEVLLDQRVVAGIGNIYKNEALWACRVDPRAQIAQLDRATVATLFATARSRMQTRDRTRHVYQRTGEPCERCSTTIVRGEVAGRTTWWCPRCQGGSDSGDRG
jgi:endonuclease VIII